MCFQKKTSKKMKIMFLQNSDNKDKILEEAEKRHKMVVNRYEDILKNLNSEFRLLLERNKQLEKQLESGYPPIYNNTGDDIRQILIDQKFQIQQREHIFNNEQQKWFQERDELILNLNKQTAIIEELRHSQFNIQNQYVVNDEYVKNIKDENMSLKIKTQELINKVNDADRLIRQKDDNIIGLGRDIEQLKNGFTSSENNEKLLKSELLSLIQKHEVIEKERNSLQFKVNELSGSVKVLTEKVDSQNREVSIQMSSIDMHKKQESRYIGELASLKNEISNLEDKISIINLEKKSLASKLNEARHANERLEQICNDLISEHDNVPESRLILEKEIELKRLKEIQHRKKSSKERLELERIRKNKPEISQEYLRNF